MESDSLAPWRKVNCYSRSFHLAIAMALVFLRSFCWNEYYKEINETCIRVHPCQITLVQEPRQVISFSLSNLLNFIYQKEVSKQNDFFCLFPTLWDKKTRVLGATSLSSKVLTPLMILTVNSLCEPENCGCFLCHLMS